MQQRYGWPLWITVLLALLCQLMPLSGVANQLRPYGLLIVFCFWALESPAQVRLTVVWVLGLVVDSVTGTVLGAHAFTLVLCVGCFMMLRRRVSMSPRVQQGVVFTAMGYLYAGSLSGIQHFIHYPSVSGWYWVAPLFTAVIWCVFSAYMHSRIMSHDVL